MVLLPAELLSLLLLTTSALAAPAEEKKPGVWHFEIDNSPAPPPDSPLSPPGAAGAIRDKKYLKFELIGIVGAYLVWVLITFLLILLVGLKLRRKAQSSNRTLSMEMINPQTANEKAGPGPLSPGKIASLKAWARGGHKKSPSNVTSSTIDSRLVEEDRVKNMDEMANLYAHVMAQEDARERANSSTESSPSSPMNRAFHHGQPHQTLPTPPKSPQDQNPPELQHLRQQTKPHPSESPYYYPPPQQQERFENMSQASTRVGETPRSFAASRHERNGSSNSNKLRPSRVSVRGKPISEPIGDADLSQSFGDHEATPLSPRLYTPGPAPPTPGRHSAQGLPMSPRLYNPGPPPPVPSEKQTESAVTQRRKQTPGALSLGGSTTANSSTSNLPFRQAYSGSLMSAPPTKTTFVNIRESIMGHHPKTGVPQTPYSPYMPQTPMTPVTPSRLVSRKEMKRDKKKMGLKVLSEDDMVKSDEDMWS